MAEAATTIAAAAKASSAILDEGFGQASRFIENGAQPLARRRDHLVRVFPFGVARMQTRESRNQAVLDHVEHLVAGGAVGLFQNAREIAKGIVEKLKCKAIGRLLVVGRQSRHAETLFVHRLPDRFGQRGVLCTPRSFGSTFCGPRFGFARHRDACSIGLFLVSLG